MTAGLSLIPAEAIARLPLRGIGIDDLNSLARLYLMSHPSGIGADDLGARSEILAAFAGEYGFLRGRCYDSESIWDGGLHGPFITDVFAGPAHCGLGIVVLA